MPLSLDAYAKINLTLDITGRRNDGYHTLNMVMQSISLADKIILSSENTGKIDIICGKEEIPCGKSNTIYRAAETFFIRAGLKTGGISFFIEKHIPSQAGLGGGSADAAAALKLLNEFYGTGFSNEELCELGQSVGADVPFCIVNGTALAQGIGEKMTPLAPLPACNVVIGKPSVGIGTREAYALADKYALGVTDFTGLMTGALKTGNLAGIASCLGNGFESIIKLKEVAEIKKAMLSSGALGASMTGSGSAVFGLFDSDEKAAACKTKLSEKYAEVFLCIPVPA